MVSQRFAIRGVEHIGPREQAPTIVDHHDIEAARGARGLHDGAILGRKARPGRHTNGALPPPIQDPTSMPLRLPKMDTEFRNAVRPRIERDVVCVIDPGDVQEIPHARQ